MIKHVVVLLSSILFFVLIVYSSGPLSEIIFWIALPILISYALGFKPKNIGLSLPPKKEIPLIAAVFLLSIGINYFASTIPEMRAYYSTFYSISLTSFAFWILSVTATEFFFRGYMLFGLEKKTGKWSMLIQAVPYVLIHIGKPLIEIYFSFFAGIIFAYINLRSRSFLPSLIIHLTGFLVIVFSQMS